MPVRSRMRNEKWSLESSLFDSRSWSPVPSFPKRGMQREEEEGRSRSSCMAKHWHASVGESENSSLSYPNLLRVPSPSLRDEIGHFFPDSRLSLGQTE
ncbi:hypothetical protein HGM15179_020748 [Zosterops borbonicus]|uniref:Uncharacterized protein n=1 Tax=Zosterops borbonicus TaxID=364589 RepID=A0A8K1D5S7_9PASS|nr:hypothetical protein HGM15179_020748 [Zosterops borbonicus]